MYPSQLFVIFVQNTNRWQQPPISTLLIVAIFPTLPPNLANSFPPNNFCSQPVNFQQLPRYCVPGAAVLLLSAEMGPRCQQAGRLAIQVEILLASVFSLLMQSVASWVSWDANCKTEEDTQEAE